MLIGRGGDFSSEAGIGAHGQVSTIRGHTRDGTRLDEHFADRADLRFLRRQDSPARQIEREDDLPDNQGGWKGQGIRGVQKVQVKPRGCVHTP